MLALPSLLFYNETNDKCTCTSILLLAVNPLFPSSSVSFYRRAFGRIIRSLHKLRSQIQLSLLNWPTQGCCAAHWSRCERSIQIGVRVNERYFSSGDWSRISALRDSRPSPSPHKSLQHRSTRLPSVAVPTSCSSFLFFLLLLRLSFSVDSWPTEPRREQQRAPGYDSPCVLPSVFLSLSSNCPSSSNVPSTRETISVAHPWPSSQPAAGHTLPRAFFRPEWANGARIPDCRGSWSLHWLAPGHVVLAIGPIPTQTDVSSLTKDVFINKAWVDGSGGRYWPRRTVSQKWGDDRERSYTLTLSRVRGRILLRSTGEHGTVCPESTSYRRARTLACTCWRQDRSNVSRHPAEPGIFTFYLLRWLSTSDWFTSSLLPGKRE